jgi:Ca-activated chloride channel family protein
LEIAMTDTLPFNADVLLSPRRAGLRSGQDNIVEVLVRVQAPEVPAGHVATRPPQALALVIDRSGSMEGRPIAEARRCADYVIGKLRSTDAVSLVQFDNRVQRLWPAVPVGDGSQQRTATAGIHTGGNTNLHGGWLEGVQTLAGVGGEGIKRVILLSDGQANSGLTDGAQIAAQCAEWATKGITTSTYGLGNGFNETLMVDMARAGGGNAYYGDTAEDLMDPFQQELELLGNLCLREPRLAVSVSEGVAVEMANDLVPVDGGWRLPDLAWGAEAWAVLRIRVPASALPRIGDRFTVLRVRVDGKSLDGQAVNVEARGLLLTVLSPAAFDGLTDDEAVTQRLVELAAARALTELRGAAELRDWAAVDRMLARARRQFAGNAWVEALLTSMAAIAAGRERERMMKESSYSSSKLQARLVAKDERADFLAAHDSASVPAYLRRKSSQGKGLV